VRAKLLAVAAVAALVAAGCAGRPGGPSDTIVMWTTQADQLRVDAQQQVIDAFEAANPGLHVDLVPKPEQGGTGDTSTILTAVRGNVQPDVYMMGRFPVSQYAALGLLQPLDGYLDDAPEDILAAHNTGAVNEVRFDSQQFAVPLVMDARALFYNKQMLRDVGVDPDVLDPADGPPTVAEVEEIAAKVTTTGPGGNYERMGFIPWEGEGWALTWAIGNDATFFDEDSCRLTLDTDPGIRTAYDDFAHWRDELDFRRVDAFKASYSPPDAPPSQNAFLNGRLAMIETGTFQVSALTQYAPDLDYGITYLPVQQEGDTPYSWSGGAGLVMPTGGTNTANAWKLIEFFTSVQGQRIFSSATGDLPSRTDLVPEIADASGQSFFTDVLSHTTSRVPIPVGSTLFEAMKTAQEAVLLGQDPGDALDEAQQRVDPQMEQYCPYPLPAEYRQGDRTP